MIWDKWQVTLDYALQSWGLLGQEKKNLSPKCIQAQASKEDSLKIRVRDERKKN